MRITRLAVAGFTLAGVATLSGCLPHANTTNTTTSASATASVGGSSTTTPPTATQGNPTGSTETSGAGAAITAELAKITVVPSRPEVPGYERGCGKDQACSFGPAWTDNTSAPGGHNGCGTRDDVLKASMTDVQFKSGSTCVVVAGNLADPYTGQTIHFTKADASKVQIDHILPLALAWDMGASTWTQAERDAYANDEAVVLVAADGAANMSKSDDGPGLWMPPNAAYHCQYIVKYLTAAATYHLSITQADAVQATRTAATC